MGTHLEAEGRSGRLPGVPSLVARDLGAPLVSYSQNAEDVRLWRVLGDVPDGCYVDIGAYHPVTCSVTKLFYDAGWQGINVEPGPAFDLLVEQRPRDRNVRAAIGVEAGTVRFWLTHPNLGLSTRQPDVHAHVPELVDRLEEVTVDCVPLERLLAEHVPNQVIHFLKIDVEGGETDVIASNDWQRFRPLIVVVEAVATMDSTPTHDRWEPTLLRAGYRFAVFDGLNRFYVAEEHAELAAGLAYPMGVLDHYLPAEQVELRRAHAEQQAEIARLDAEVRRREALNADLAAAVERLRCQLDAVLTSRTWRTGRVAWHAAKPLRALWRLLGRATS